MRLLLKNLILGSALALSWQSLNPSSVAARYIVRPLDQAVFHNNQGVQFLGQGDLQRALFEFKSATEISNLYVEAWNNLGLTYIYLNKYDRAKEALLKSIDIDKDYPTPYNHMSTIYYNQGNYKEAIAWAEKAIKQDKKYADAYYNLGISYRELSRQTRDPKDLAEGEKAFRFATESSPTHYLANYELGNLYQEQGKLEQALIRYKSALEIQPSAPQAWTQLGKLYLLKGQNNLAQSAFNKALAADGKNAEAHLNLGLLYLQDKNFALADRELSIASSVDPQNPRVMAALAFSKLNRAEYQRSRAGAPSAEPLYRDALASYQALLARYPSFADAAYNIGNIYVRLADIGQAQIWYQKTLSLNPRYDRALFSLGSLYLEQKRTKEGLAHLCNFVKSTAPELAASRDLAQKMIAQHGSCK